MTREELHDLAFNEYMRLTQLEEYSPGQVLDLVVEFVWDRAIGDITKEAYLGYPHSGPEDIVVSIKDIIKLEIK